MSDDAAIDQTEQGGSQREIEMLGEDIVDDDMVGRRQQGCQLCFQASTIPSHVSGTSPFSRNVLASRIRGWSESTKGTEMKSAPVGQGFSLAPTGDDADLISSLRGRLEHGHRSPPPPRRQQEKRCNAKR